MNVYDTANRLSQEIKESEEYKRFKEEKDVLESKPDVKKKIKDFENARYEVQMLAIQTGKTDDQKIDVVHKMYVDLMNDEDAQKYLNAETQFNTLIADVNKIIGESVKDLI